ncbi:MAG: hypothetical protein R6X02_21170 [Enhygromyxa sp.]
MTRIDPLARPIGWSFDFEMVFLFEIAVDEARRHLPAPLMPIELRPGVGVLGIGVQSLCAGNLGELPEVREIYCTIAVQPQLSVPMPTPRFAVVPVIIAATAPSFLARARELDRLNAMPWTPTLDIELDRAGLRARAADDRGPIFELWNVHEQPSFVDAEMWGQEFVGVDDDPLYFQAWHWRARKAEYQRRGGGRLHPHPFFAGIDLDAVSPDPYMQFITPPQTDGTLTLFAPIPLANIQPRRRVQR